MQIKYFLFFFFLISGNLIAQTNTIAPVKETDEKVYTPIGAVSKSKVHLVSHNQHLRVTNGHIQIVDTKTGMVTQEFDEGAPAKKNNDESRVIPNYNSSIAGIDDGWVTFAYCFGNSSHPITYFSTNWIVPQPPDVWSEQTIFLFSSLMPVTQSAILQPVLQYGYSALGGGKYWSIADWFVTADSNVFHDDLVPVNPGTNLQGVMSVLSKNDTTYNYYSTFQGYSSLGLEVDSVPLLNLATQTLEVYGVTGCDEYPADTSVRMSGIQIKSDSIYPALTWDTISYLTDYGQFTKTIINSSHGGEVDIHFYKSCGLAAVEDIPAQTGEISLYPNPSSTITTIIIPQNSDWKNVNIEILNMQGQLIKALAATGHETNIDISDYDKGIYFIRLKTQGNVTVKKFVRE